MCSINSAGSKDSDILLCVLSELRCCVCIIVIMLGGEHKSSGHCGEAELTVSALPL